MGAWVSSEHEFCWLGALMATVMELRGTFGLDLSHDGPGAGDSFSRAVAAVAAVLDDENVEAHAAWFDRSVDRHDAGLEIGVHLRLITAKGVITLDHEFSFRGHPDARFIPWSQVTQLNVIAHSLEGSPLITIDNSWLESKLGRVEFAGADSAEKHAVLVRAIRRYLR
jgi:hypothetical protein